MTRLLVLALLLTGCTASPPDRPSALGVGEAPALTVTPSSAAPSRTAAPRKAARTRIVEMPLSGQHLHLNWTALAECESGGNPRAVSPTGKFRGLVQFSLSSWHAVGMTGDPIDYPADVQIAAAVRLLRLQGRGAWPECGRFL